MNRLAIVGMLAVLALHLPDASAQRITSGLSFLKLGAGADGIGRADAFVADPTPAQAIFYNPGAIGDADRASVMVMHNESIQDIRNDVLGVNIPMGDWAIGAGLQATTVSGIEVRDNASTQPLGTFTSIEGAMTFGASYAATSEWSVGMSVKALIEKIYINDAVGGAVDVGVRFRPEHTPWAFGLALQNIGVMGILANESITLPAMIRAGAAYTGTFGEHRDFAYVMEAAGDKTFADEGLHARFGGQLVFDNMLFFRAGLKTGYDAGAFSTGVGFRYKFLQLDYALQPFADSYGTGHVFSLNVSL